jgi:hypothetical protein
VNGAEFKFNVKRESRVGRRQARACASCLLRYSCRRVLLVSGAARSSSAVCASCGSNEKFCDPRLSNCDLIVRRCMQMALRQETLAPSSGDGPVAGNLCRSGGSVEDVGTWVVSSG